MSTFVQNVRFGLRMLIKQPTISTISILALALGIGLTTTMYSIVHGALRDLPFEDAHEIVMLGRTGQSEQFGLMDVTQHEFVDWRTQQRSFEDLAAFYQGTINVRGTERPIRFNGAFMTPETYGLIGARPLLGRLPTPDDASAGAAPALLLGYEVWQNHFRGDRDAVGRAVRVNGREGTIIGVMPDGFAFPMAEEAWLPLTIDLTTLAARGDGMQLDVVGRLRDGVSIDAARVELEGLTERLERQYPDTNEGIRGSIIPYVREYIDQQGVAMLWTMQGAVFMVLLIACANVANLILSRAFDRTREIAVRTALGARRRRIVGQILTEVLVLAVIGGVLGIGIAQVGVTMFNDALAGVEIPYWIDIRIDWVVMAFTTAAVLAASVVAGLVPALQVTGRGLNDVLKDESRGSSSFRLGRLSRTLVVAEVALSCGLLVGAGLMIKSVAQLGSLDFGFPTDIFTARVGLFDTDYPQPRDRAEFFGELRRRLLAEPGVTGVAITSTLPGASGNFPNRLAIEGESYASREDHPRASRVVTSPGLFESFGVELLQGRDFDDTDTAEAVPVAIVNASFVDRYLQGESPIGKRFRWGTDPDEGGAWLTIVGVVPDLYIQGVDNVANLPPQGVYTPLTQDDRGFMSVAVRTQGPPLEIAGAVRGAIAALDPDLPIYWVQTLQTLIEDNTWFYRVFGALFMVFGVVALFLATVGLYGVMSFAVRRRTQEVGIRMALGARTGDVRSMVVAQGAWQIAIGLVLGMGLAMVGAGGLELVLFQVDPRDVTIYGAIGLALAATGLTACLLPANRASRIDPIIALRSG